MVGCILCTLGKIIDWDCSLSLSLADLLCFYLGSVHGGGGFFAAVLLLHYLSMGLHSKEISWVFDVWFMSGICSRMDFVLDHIHFLI